MNRDQRGKPEDQRSEACGIFVRNHSGRLALRVSFGGALDERVREFAEQVVDSVLAGALPDPGDGSAHMLIAAPLLLHARPIGALVVERASSVPYSALEIRRLSAVASEIVGIIESARLIEAVEGTSLSDRAPPAPSAQTSSGEHRCRASGGSPGIAIGAIAFRQAFPRGLLLPEAPVAAVPDVERQRVQDALQRARNDLSRLQSMTAGEIGEEQALVFGSHLLLLADPALWERVEQGIAGGASAPAAVDRAFEEIAKRLAQVRDPYLRERVEDVEDLCSRILGHLIGARQAWAPDPQLIVCRRMTASLVVELKVRGAFGIASELGGATSHGLMLARALGIPAVTGVSGITRHARSGETLIIDGEQELAVLRPSTDTLAEYSLLRQSRDRARSEYLVFRDRPAATADGVRFPLRANIALGVDLELAREHGAEGVGLYRTEFPFMVREGLPTVDEQVRIYEKAYDAFPDGPIAFRLLDVGGDKFVPSHELGGSSQVFHGYRSIRVLFDYPHVLRDQVQAFALAAGQRTLSILIPMVSSIEELRRVKELVSASLAQHPETAQLPPPRFGAMVEVPAAVELCAELANEVDFLSIGTNDLIQYSLVVDREDPRMSTRQHAFHPAILRMVRRVVVAARAAGKEVSVCGEMAARPELAIALLALGVDALSVAPAAIPELKQKLAQWPLQPVRAAISGILAAATAAELEQALRACLTEHVAS